MDSKLARKNNHRGKRAEKGVTNILPNTKNVSKGKGCDLINKDYSIEVKDVARFIGRKWCEQAKKNNVGLRKPIVVVHIRGSRFKNSYVLINIQDFLDAHKDIIEVLEIVKDLQGIGSIERNEDR